MRDFNYRYHEGFRAGLRGDSASQLAEDDEYQLGYRDGMICSRGESRSQLEAAERAWAKGEGQ